MATVDVIVPQGGPGCPWRAAAFRWVSEHYGRHHGDWAFTCGHAGEPWSKGRAVNRAVARTDGDILVIADADSFVDPDALRANVDTVARHGGWGMPHRDVYRLSQESTEALYAGARVNLKSLARPMYRGILGGGIVVIGRADYQRVGGIDPRFEGWGGEDQTFGWVLRSLIGWPHTERTNLIHLWHPHPAPDLRGSPESEALVDEYRPHRRDAAGLLAIIESRRNEPDPPPHEDGDRDDVHGDRDTRRDG